MVPSSIYDSSISSVMPDPNDLGLPNSDPSPPANMGLITSSPDTSNLGLLGKLENVATSAITSLENGVGSVGSGIESGIVSGYGAVKTVASDAVGGVKNVVNFGTTQIVILVGVVGLALYFIGKTGAFKVNAGV